MPDDMILTESSFQQLQAELETLRTTKRAEIAESIRKARAYGDLSENFEYQEARRAQGILNGRIQYLSKLLEVAKVVPDAEGEPECSGLGSIVRIRDLETEDEWEYTLVDAVQADPLNDRISYNSPVGQALMNCRVGDVVEVNIPAGMARYEILEISR